MYRRKAKYPLWLSILLAVLSAFWANQKAHQPPPPVSISLPTQATQSANYLIVTRVIDGDTFQLENGEHVRLIGIDTPESSANKKAMRDSNRTGQSLRTITTLGKEAKQFVRQLIEGKSIRLEYDVTPRDKYGRLLAYVYLPDGTLINNEIIRRGYASPMTIPPNVKHEQLFKESYQTARQEKIGLWAEDVQVTGR